MGGRRCLLQVSRCRREREGRERNEREDILTSQEMSFQMLGVKVSLVAIRAGKFSIRVFDRCVIALGDAIDALRRDSGPSRSTGQYPSSPLRANNVLFGLFSAGVCKHVCAAFGLRPYWRPIVGLVEEGRRH